MDEDRTVSLSADQDGAALPDARESWGDFKLLARVGYGGFGEVYRAWDPNLQREVALKLLLAGAVAGDKQYEQMLREARALAAVQHPNIVHVYGIDRHDGRVGFWTDFVRGKTLAALLREQGQFGCREAALIGMDVAKALSAVHRAGILHRDIKAENVMREEGGRVLLLDFGLSTLPQRQTNLAGTPNYMAPELFTGAPASVTSDIYAMGVLLYFLVTGAHPAKLGGLSLEEVSTALAGRTTLVDLRCDLPHNFTHAVNKAMDLEPAKRFSSAGQLASALAESLGSASPAPAISTPERPRYRRALYTAFGALVVLASVGLPGRVSSWFRKPPPAGRVSVNSPSDEEQYQKAEDLLLKSYKNANTAEAVKQFQAILTSDPNYALAEAGLGAAFFIQYRNSHDPKLLEQAEVSTKRAMQLDPNLSPPYVTLARIAAMEGKTPVATQYAQRAMSLDPNSADAYRAMSEVYDAQGRKTEAIAAMQKAADLAPEDWRWAQNLGSRYFALGKLADAESWYKKAAALAPENQNAFRALGGVYLRLDRLGDAEMNLKRALAIEPGAETYQLLGEVLQAEGKFGEAVDITRKAVDLNGQSYEIWADLAAAYLMTASGHDRAMAAYKRAIDLAEQVRIKEPRNAKLLVILANAYASLGEKSRSEQLLRQSLALTTTDPYVTYAAGATYELLGNRQQSAPLVATAIAQGYSLGEMERDPLLTALRKDAGFQEALRKAKQKILVDGSN